MIHRILKLFYVPYRILWAALYPVSYAKHVGVKINGRVTIYGSSYKMFSAEPYLVTLEDNVFISVDACFICHDGGVLPFRTEHPSLDLAAPISVGAHTFIGMRAIILKGVTIGERCIVAAGSVVTRSVPEGAIVGGNPARVIGQTDDYIMRGLKNSLEIGHIYGPEKHKRYKKIFGVE